MRPSNSLSSHAPALHQPFEVSTGSATGSDQPLQPLYVHTLGAACIEIGDVRLGISAEVLFALVLRLLFTPGMGVPRATLLRELWPSYTNDRARGNLRQSLYKLRTLGVRITQVGERVHLDRAQLHSTFSVDRTCERFEQNVIQGKEPFGTFVPGFVPPSEAMRRWLDLTREEVHADVRRVLVEELRGRRERADWSGAEVLSRWLLQFDPLNEDATLTLAECAMLAGGKAEAVAILDAYLDELGPDAGDIRLPATLLRKRFTDPHTRRRASSATTEQHFVGREDELSTLTLAMKRARWHDGSAVLLHGPPGIGKSRLLAELSKVAQIEGYHEICLECRESEKGRPLGVFLEILPELLDSPGALGCAPESLTVLRRLVGSAIDERSSTNPAYHSIRHALLDVLAAISEEQPLLFLLEDTQWIDEDSWECIADVLQRATAMRVFLVATSRHRFGLPTRPSRFPSTVRVMEVGALSESEILQLVERICQHYYAHPSANLKTWFADVSEGNPLMIRSLVHHWIETGEAGGVPPTLQVLLEHRISRLHPLALRAMQVVALLGPLATPERVRATLELPIGDLLNALDQLQNDACLTPSNARLISTHDLIGNAAIAKLAPLLRGTLHTAIADVLLAEFARFGSHEVLMHAIDHLIRADRVDEANKCLVVNADELVAVGQPSRMLDIVSRIAQSLGSRAFTLRLSRVREELELQSGEYEKALRAAPGKLRLPPDVTLLAAEELDVILTRVDSASRADPIIDRQSLLDFCVIVAEQDALRHPLRGRAIEIGLVIAANTCDPSSATRLFAAAGTVVLESNDARRHRSIELLFHTVFGDLSISEQIALELLASSLDHRATATDAQELGRAGFALRLCGRFEESIRAFESSYRSLVKLSLPRLAEYSVWQLAQLAMDTGQEDMLVRWNDCLVQLVDREQSAVSSGYIEGHLCRVAIHQHKPIEARALLQRAKASLPRFPTRKASAYLMALELGTAQLAREFVPDDAILQASMEHHRLTASYGTSDYLTSCIIEGLGRRRAYEDADRFARSYLTSIRRERGEASEALSTALRRVVKHSRPHIEAADQQTGRPRTGK